MPSLRETMPGLFGALSAKPAPAKPADPTACAVCGCPEKGHCKGGVKHASYKTPTGGAPRGSFYCAVRHCLTPICSCTNYKKPESL